ncbi:MAG: alpha/beta fold hydrolase [Lachnospiraceae bacterium]|nr:alpha/beta fold hydrolase [Lachnospiraceae bacterium]
MRTKYPIILVHGIIAKDSRIFKCFGKIDYLLKIQGFHVYKSNVDGFGTIENNAKQLKAEIRKIMKKEGVNKVNIIGHSKGGLDSKYMIQKLGMEKHVASLTTLCTPHLGSPIAENILRSPKWLLNMIAFSLDSWYRFLGDKHPDSLKVCKELSTVTEIHDNILATSPYVYTQSYSTTMERVSDDLAMSIPLAFSHHFEKKESDGLVSNESAKYGNYRGRALADESISHSEIIDFMANKRKKAKIYSFYSNLCEELAGMGF